MEFGIEKCAILIMKSSKMIPDKKNRTTKSRENKKTRRKRHKYFGKLETDTIKPAERKEQGKKEFL